VPTTSAAKFTFAALVAVPAEETSNVFRLVAGGGSSTGTHAFGVRGVSTLGMRVGDTAAQQQQHLAYTPFAWTVLISTWHGPIGQVATSLDGGSWSVNSTPNPSVIHTDAALWIGTRGGTAQALNGDVADLMLFGVDLYTEEAAILATVKQYFRDRYGVTMAA